MTRGRARAALSNLGLAAASLSLCAALVEAGARVLVAARRSRALSAHDPLLRFHPTLGWEKVPGARAQLRRPEYATDLAVNEHGLRGPDRAYAKPPGVRRVLLLGDSFVEGYTVAEEDTLRARLEAGLRAGGGQWEVLNGGTRGYATDQEWLFYETEGRRYAPDAVVLCVYYNDLDGNGCGDARKPCFVPGPDGRPRLVRAVAPPGAEPAGYPAPDREVPRPSWRGSVALGLLSERARDGNPALHRRLAAWGLLAPPPRDPPPAELAPYGRGGAEGAWAVFASLLDALRREVAGDGASLVVLHVPARFEMSAHAWEPVAERYALGPGWDRGAVAARLRAECARRALPFVDPTRALREAASRGEAPYFHRDGHWSEAGHRIAAEALAPAVRALAPP